MFVREFPAILHVNTFCVQELSTFLLFPVYWFRKSNDEPPGFSVNSTTFKSPGYDKHKYEQETTLPYCTGMADTEKLPMTEFHSLSVIRITGITLTTHRAQVVIFCCILLQQMQAALQFFSLFAHCIAYLAL